MKRRPETPRVQPEPETVVRVLPPRWRKHDCAIWSFSVLTGIAYDEVLLAVAGIDPLAGREGLAVDDVKAVARALGVRLRLKPNYDIHEDTGLLTLYVGKKREGHAVVLKAGQIIDVDATVWDADDYMRVKESVPDELLVITPRPKRRKKDSTNI